MGMGITFLFVLAISFRLSIYKDDEEIAKIIKIEVASP